MAAALVAAAYLLSQSHFNFKSRVNFVVVLITAMLIGWHFSEVYQDRMSLALEQKTKEPNVLGRVEAQGVAFETWLRHPFGVGFSNLPTATREFSKSAQSFTEVAGSDSIYFDFLLATGAPGLLCVILCFRSCWKLADLRRVPDSAVYLKAGMVAAFVFGTAAIAPATYCVAPFFFTVAGLAACLRRDYSPKKVRRARESLSQPVWRSTPALPGGNRS
jgi:O-antigen ligase